MRLATPKVVAMISHKLHAIQQPSRTKIAQDWSDVLALIKMYKLSLDDPDFTATVLSLGGESAAISIRAAIFGGD